MKKSFAKYGLAIAAGILFILPTSINVFFRKGSPLDRFFLVFALIVYAIIAVVLIYSGSKRMRKAKTGQPPKE